MRSGLGAALGCFFVASCLAENPGGGAESGGDTTEDTDDPSETTGVPAADNMIGCPAGETCWVVLAAQTLDDRVEIFGAPAGEEPAYRGAIDLDLKPGTEIGPLDEPFGMVLSDTGLHVITGHYPSTERGAMLSFPSAFFDGRDAGLIDVDEFFGGAFNNGVIETRFDEVEPIFAFPRPVSGKLLVSVFANDLFAGEETWTSPGKLAVVDAADPSDFALTTLNGLEGGDCLGASQLILLQDDQTAAVACDGNEGVAFLDLGDLSGSVADAANGITGSYCDLPFPSDRRVRYLAHDGFGGVLVGVGPSINPSIASQVFSVTPGSMPADCTFEPIQVADSDGQLGELVPFGAAHWLLAQGALAPEGDRGVQVIAPDGICNTLPGLEDAWETDGDRLSPYAITVAPDGEHLLIGAATAQVGSIQNAIYGKVLWVTLSGASDPCTMTASAVDLTDGGAGRAPAPLGGDEKTWRRSPIVVTLTEVQGA
ncbi:MAG: hypothetical protein ACE37F_02875 [Nannocystaceae bacterium]|nr:hypothetical protein [bacterium]